MPPKNSPRAKTATKTPGAAPAAGPAEIAEAAASAVPPAAAAPPKSAESTALTDGGEPAAPGAAPAGAEPPGEPADGAGAARETPAGAAGTTRRNWRVPALLGAVTVLLGGFGVWATLHASSLRASNAGQNVALTDAAATKTVKQQVGTAINEIFSYKYTDTAATRQTAQNLLTGNAIKQYNQLFALVEKEAPAQKLIVTTTVTSSGVQFLSGDRARLLIFANQQSTRHGTSQSSYGGAMFAVTAVHAGSRWKIENIDTFTGS